MENKQPLTQWHYAVDNIQHGPVSSRELKSLAMQGTLKPTDLVWNEDMPNWAPANQFKALFSVAPLAQSLAGPPRIPTPSPIDAISPLAGEAVSTASTSMLTEDNFTRKSIKNASEPTKTEGIRLPSLISITPDQVREVVARHFDQNDPLVGFCIATRLRVGFMNAGTKYIGYSRTKIVLCQMFGTRKEVSHDLIQVRNVTGVKKSSFPFARIMESAFGPIYTISYRQQRGGNAAYKLWFLTINGYKNNVVEAMKLIQMLS